MISATVISDTHGQHSKLTLPPADVLIHCGDYGNMGTREEAVKFAEWLATLSYQHIWVSPGNHDGFTQESPDEAKEIFASARAGIRLFLHEPFEFDGKKWFFSPYTKNYAGWWWMLEEDELATKWAEIPNDTEYLVVHGPPHMINDTIEREEGAHAGSKTLLHRVQQLPKLKHFFSGHLHYTSGTTVQHNGVKYTNAAMLNDRNQFLGFRPEVFTL